jgi:hypothetical protein
MNNTRKLWPNPKIRILAIQLTYQLRILKQMWYKYFIHTLQYLNQFPKKMYEIYFYK